MQGTNGPLGHLGKEIYRWAGVALTSALMGGFAHGFSQYQVVELPVFGGGDITTATAVNDLGHVVGYGRIPDPDGQIAQGVYRGFFWTGTYKTIIPANGGNSSYALDINNSDQVVGYREQLNLSINQLRNRAFLWFPNSSQVHSIPNLGASDLMDASANAINDHGLVAGTSSAVSAPGNWRAFRYQFGGNTTPLPFPASEAIRNSYGYGVSPDGQIVGTYETLIPSVGNYEERGFSYASHASVNLGKWFPSFLVSYETSAVDVNTAGVIVGQARIDSNTFRAVRQTVAGTWIGIPLLSGVGSDPVDDSNVAHSINTDGDIVGNSEIGNTNRRAFILELGRGVGTPVDLNTRIPIGSGWVLQDARNISDLGYIVGVGLKGGVQRGFLLRPIVTIEGTITLEDWNPLPTGQKVTIELRDPITNTLVESKLVTLNGSGGYSFTTQKLGAYKLVAKAWHWLSDREPTLTLNGDRSGVDFILPNGDCDNDNTVSVFDYDVLSAAFDSVKNGPSWDARADLDGDETVTVFDYDILSTNFDRDGLD